MGTDDWRRDRIRLTLPNDLAYVGVARSAVRAAALPYGYSTSELDNWETVIEEAMTNVVTFAYAAGERASFDIDCLLEPNGLTVLVRDQGKPFDPDRIRSIEFDTGHPGVPPRGLGWHLMHRLMDVVGVESLGREGKQISLFKAAPHRLSARSARRAAPVQPSAQASDVVCRKATADDAIEIIRLFYDCYRYSYFNEQVYNLQGLRRMIADGDIESFVAAVPGGPVVAHAALIHYPDRPNAIECGMAVAEPANRGHHFSQQVAKLVDERLSQAGRRVVFAGCVTVHVAAQKIAVRSGLNECGLMLGAVPAEDFTALKPKDRGRGTILFLAGLRADRPPPALVLPPGHQDFIGGLYAQCGMPFARGEAGPAAAGDSDITASVRPKIGVVRALVHRIGGDLIGRIKAMMHAARQNRAEVGQLFLPLVDRALPDAVAALEPLGWFVTGILPEGALAGDVLLMHWLNGWAMNYDALKIARREGRQLVEHVRACDPDSHDDRLMSSAGDIARELRGRYRQPTGVEQFGIEPIPEARKNVGWFDLFSIMFNFLINPGTLLTGGLMVAAGLSFQAAVAAGFLGTATALVFYVVMATLGVDYGIPGQVATRAVFGLHGSKAIPSLLRTVASVYWFSFQTFAGASAIVAILAKMTGTTFPLITVSVIFGLIQACVAIVGFGSLKVLARVALPLKVVVLAYLFVLFAWHDEPGFAPRAVLAYPGTNSTWLLLAGWLNVTIASWFTNIADAADFARYTRSRTDMWAGTFTAGVLGALLSTALGAYGAAATLGKVTNPFVLTAQIEVNSLALLAVLAFLCLDAWTINVLNLYSAGLSLSNMFERIGRFWTTLMASLLGVALSADPDVQNYFHYVNLLGNIFAPVAGVLVFDYLLVSRMRIDVAALYDPKGRYRYASGFNLIAVGWTLLGVPICSYVIPAAFVPALTTSLIVGTGYSLTMLSVRQT